MLKTKESTSHSVTLDDISMHVKRLEGDFSMICLSLGEGISMDRLSLHSNIDLKRVTHESEMVLVVPTHVRSKSLNVLVMHLPLLSEHYVLEIVRD